MAGSPVRTRQKDPPQGGSFCFSRSIWRWSVLWVEWVDDRFLSDDLIDAMMTGL
jgi:hypothetical protein